MDLSKDKTFIDYIENCLRKNDLISVNESAKLTPRHFITVNGAQCSHYLVECGSKKFFLKTEKDRDNTIFILNNLKNFSNEIDLHYFPHLLTEPFSYENTNYYFLNYIEGDPLGNICDDLTDNEWEIVTDGIKNRIGELQMYRQVKYSENGRFSSANFGKVMTDKLAERLGYPLQHNRLITLKTVIIDKFKYLLKDVVFPEACLIHMDIKPGNIIYNRKTQEVFLIDFENSRFCDFDYGNVQILLTKYKRYNATYTTRVIPRLNERFTLDYAVNDNKCLCYLFYQTLCNIIYFESRRLLCPKEMVGLFDSLLDELVKR